MCPACYINGLLFLLFGASCVAIANNPWVIALSIILTLAAFYWIYKGWKKRTPGTFKKNIKTTLKFVAIFVAGFIVATYTTHDFFSKSPHHLNEEQQSLFDTLEDK